MAGAAKGTALKVYWNTGSYATPVYTAVGGIYTDSLDISMSPRDTTDKDSSDWEEKLDGIRSFTLSGTCHFDEGDSAADQIMDDIIANTLTKFEYKTIDSNKYSGDGYLTAVGLSAAHDGVVDQTFTLTGTGALTQASA